jgi:hypothetical protein
LDVYIVYTIRFVERTHTQRAQCIMYARQRSVVRRLIINYKYARFPKGKGDQPKCPIKTIASHPPTRMHAAREREERLVNKKA